MGRKRKQIDQDGIEMSATNEVSEETNTPVTGDTPLGHSGDDGLDPEREAIYKTYEDSVAESETVPEKTEEKANEIVAEAPPVEGEAVVKPTTEVIAIEDKKKDDTKTVPYDALHEEREKRKLAQARTRELEDKLKELEARISTQKPDEQMDEEYLTDEEKRVKVLEKAISELKERDTQRQKQDNQSKEQTAREKLERDLSDTDKTLSDAGYPGFQFLSSRVGDELRKLVQEDPDNVVLDTPEGWKKIYVEKVFPAVRGLFVQADKQGMMDDKKASKTGIGLASSSGTANKPPAKKDEDGWSYDDYLSFRRNGSI